MYLVLDNLDRTLLRRQIYVLVTSRYNLNDFFDTLNAQPQ